MEEKELMMDDWVSQSNGHPVKIDWIKTGEYGYCEGGKRKVACTPLLEPIPLTPEILEKNGWAKHATYGASDEDILEEIYMLYGHNFEVIFTNKTPISIRHFTQTDDDGYDRLLLEPCNNTMSVHVLQHAMRLFGLNELADNFVV